MSSVIAFVKQLSKLDLSGDEWGWVDVSDELDEHGKTRITVEAPQETPYAGGLYHLWVEIGEVPRTSPKVTFLTRIWHPLVDHKTGKLCQDFFTEDWKPTDGVTGFFHRLRAFFRVTKVHSYVNNAAGEEIGREDGSFEAHANQERNLYA